MDIEGTNQYWIKFGGDGLDFRLPSDSTINVGELDSDMNLIEYTRKSDFDSKINELETKVNNIDLGNIELSDYVKKSDVGLNIDLMNNGYLKLDLNIGE